LLLDYVDRRQVYQALLAAINVGNEEIAETIIEHPKYDEISAEVSRRRGPAFQPHCAGRSFNDDSQFSEEITPLILASQQNRFEVHYHYSTASWIDKVGGRQLQFSDGPRRFLTEEIWVLKISILFIHSRKLGDF